MSVFEIAVCRSFSIGFTIFSPALNGLSIEIQLACFLFRARSKGRTLFQFNNYWVRQTRR